MDLMRRIDPELIPVIEMTPVVETFTNENLPGRRIMMEEIFRDMIALLPPVEGIETEDRSVPGPEGDPDVPVRIYTPAEKTGPMPGLFWIHGGGYILGSLEIDDRRMRQISAGTGCVIVSVNYRLAPENPFPTPVEDCYAALKWMFDNHDNLHVDQSRIAIGGGSAGGGLAAGLAILTRDRAEMEILFQLLIYPMIDDRNITPSSHAITDPRTWNREKNLFAWKAYLGDAVFSDYDVSPYGAPSRAEDLSGLPPAYIAVGELDLFLDEDIEYGQRLMQAGVSTEIHVYPGATHAFDGVETAALSKRFIREREEALKRAFFI